MSFHVSIASTFATSTALAFVSAAPSVNGWKHAGVNIPMNVEMRDQDFQALEIADGGRSVLFAAVRFVMGRGEMAVFIRGST
jgi:hypothetical protein